jgi:DNA-directed RNA polymerase subunit RPC12/RpoP
MKTAEWLCTSCDATNRRLVEDEVTQTEDRCVHCRKRHVVTEDARPVRWISKPK